MPGCAGRLEHLGDEWLGFVAEHQTQPDQGIHRGHLQVASMVRKVLKGLRVDALVESKRRINRVGCVDTLHGRVAQTLEVLRDALKHLDETGSVSLGALELQPLVEPTFLGFEGLRQTIPFCADRALVVPRQDATCHD